MALNSKNAYVIKVEWRGENTSIYNNYKRLMICWVGHGTFTNKH